MRGFADYGHGGADSGAVGYGRLEKKDIMTYGMKVTKRLREHGIEITEDRTTDTTMSLTERTNIEKASKYDFTISFHRNAFSDPGANGVETWVYNGHSGREAGILANAINSRLVNLGFTNRGVKEGNLHMLRETNSPACLIEMGFITNANDNVLFDSKLNDIVEAIVQGVCEYMYITYKPPYVAPSQPTTPPTESSTFFRVVVGSYNSRENAVAQQEKLKQAGFDSFLVAYQP